MTRLRGEEEGQEADGDGGFERKGGAMDASTIRIICAVLALVLLGVIVMRRRRAKAE
jgi:MYXO-CTERM domain-containing protein